MNAVRWNFSSPSIGNTDSVYTYSSQIADSIFGKIFYYVSGINWRPMASFNDFCHMDGKRFPLSNHTKYSSSQFPKERMKNTLYTQKKNRSNNFYQIVFWNIFHMFTRSRRIAIFVCGRGDDVALSIWGRWRTVQILLIRKLGAKKLPKEIRHSYSAIGPN